MVKRKTDVKSLAISAQSAVILDVISPVLVVSKKLFHFCELEWNKSSLEFYTRKDLISKTASNVQIRKKIYKYDSHKYKIYKANIALFYFIIIGIEKTKK